MLAALWIFYGTLHFVLFDETARQVPPYIPFPAALAAITGALEIVFALLLLSSRTRRVGACGLLVLLVAYVPAIMHMFVHDVLPLRWPQPIRVALRAIIFPHHVLIALWLWVNVRVANRPRST